MEEKKLRMTVLKDSKSIKFRSWLQFLSSVTAIIILALLTSFIRVRIDLTEDRRYTLSEQTRKILTNLKNDIYIQVYLDGEIPIPLKRLKRSVREMLDEFRIASGRKIDYEFINPSEGKNVQQRNAQYQLLEKKGLNPVI